MPSARFARHERCHERKEKVRSRQQRAKEEEDKPLAPPPTGADWLFVDNEQLMPSAVISRLPCFDADPSYLEFIALAQV